jgi:hypothetical protein
MRVLKGKKPAVISPLALEAAGSAQTREFPHSQSGVDERHWLHYRFAAG